MSCRLLHTQKCTLPSLATQYGLINTDVCGTSATTAAVSHCAIHRNPQVTSSFTQTALTMAMGEFPLPKRAATKHVNIPTNTGPWDSSTASLRLTTPAAAMLLMKPPGISLPSNSHCRNHSRKKFSVPKFILQNEHSKLYQ